MARTATAKNTAPVKAAKATKAAKAAKTPAKAAKAAAKTTKKGLSKAEVKAQLQALNTETFIARARVKNYLNRALNATVDEAVEAFREKNSKILSDPKIKELDSVKRQEYNSVLTFTPVLKGLSGDARTASEAKQLKKHKAAVAKAVAADKLLARYAKWHSLNAQLRVIRSDKVNSGQSAFIGIAAFLDEVDKTIINFACKQVVSDGHKRVNTSHCLAGGVENTPLYSTFSGLDTYIRTFERLVAEQNREEGEEAEASAPEEEVSNVRDFTYYVRKLSRAVIVTTPQFEGVTFGKATNKFLSDLNANIVNNLADVLRELLSVRKAKTIKYDLVKVAIASVMKWNGQETVELFNTMDARVESWAADRQRRAAENQAKRGSSGKASAATDDASSADSSSESSDESSSSDSSSE